MAHLRSYTPEKCFECTKTATCSLYGRGNELYGHYCKVHGNRRLKELQKTEKAEMEIPT